MNKAELRKEVLQKRDSIEPSIKKIKDRAVMARLKGLNEFKSAKTLLLYASFRSEVDTHELIKECLGAQKRVLLPRVNYLLKKLEIREIESLNDIEKGHWGIPEPKRTTPLRDLNTADIIIVPGVCFDRKGGRIGYGAGYYDKLLKGLNRAIPVIALAYDEQIVEEVPLEAHDRRVDMIITDREVIYCGLKKD
jgi:5-formyltetrahydrofolate cyclo-ligase